MMCFCPDQWPPATAWRWPHFSPVELACRCSGAHCDHQYWHDESFLDALEALRSEVGKALIITSGHRCAGHNRAVGGVRRSRHLQIAVDVSLYGHDRQYLLNSARNAGFTGIGLAKTFLHLDRRARPAQWHYPGAFDLWQT